MIDRATKLRSIEETPLTQNGGLNVRRKDESQSPNDGLVPCYYMFVHNSS